MDIRTGELKYKKRGQTIASWLTPLVIVLAGIFAYFTMGENNQTEVLAIFLKFVLGLAALFVAGRIVSGVENIFTKKK